jgi:hypothetical protein
MIHFRPLLTDTQAELDEEVLLMSFFVFLAIAGMTALGNAVSDLIATAAGLV